MKDKIELIRTNTILENARFIKGDIKEVFERVNPVIENIMNCLLYTSSSKLYLRKGSDMFGKKNTKRW